MKELINSYIHTKNCLTKSVLPPFTFFEQRKKKKKQEFYFWLIIVGFIIRFDFFLLPNHYGWCYLP